MASTQRFAAASARHSLLPRAKKRVYVCLNCQLRALSIPRWPPTPSCAPQTTTTTTLTQSRHYANNQRPNDGFEGSFADKLRKKIWGTDNPPGQRNPYVRESPEELEERLLEEEERKLREREEKDFERIRQGRPDDEEAVAMREQEVVDDVAEVDEVVEEEGEREGALKSRKKEQERGYVPATTWKKLRHIPGWKAAQLPPRPWFQGFLAPGKVEDKDDIERAIQRAVVEVRVMKQAAGTTTLPAKIGKPTADFEERLAASAAFDKDDKSLVFKDQTLKEDIMRSLGLLQDEEVEAEEEEEEEIFDHVPDDMIEGEPQRKKGPYQADVETTESVPLMEGEVGEDPATGAPEKVIAIAEPGEDIVDIEEEIEVEEDIPKADPSYRFVAFNEPDFKFAVLKRVMQLTGTRIADPAIPRLNSAADLVTYLIKPAPAKKLAEDLVKNDQLSSLPNVQIWNGRYLAHDKEVEIGRWKLIEAELQRRGLPTEELR